MYVCEYMSVCNACMSDIYVNTYVMFGCLCIYDVFMSGYSICMSVHDECMFLLSTYLIYGG